MTYFPFLSAAVMVMMMVRLRLLILLRIERMTSMVEVTWRAREFAACHNWSHRSWKPELWMLMSIAAHILSKSNDAVREKHIDASSDGCIFESVTLCRLTTFDREGTDQCS